MAFALTGITNERSLRFFAFQLAGSRPRTTVVVVADMALVRQYEIPLQELPLLCLRLLENGATSPDGTVIFPEREMIEFANRRREAKEFAEQKRRAAKPDPQGNS
jgi:hypothetical protein